MAQSERNHKDVLVCMCDVCYVKGPELQQEHLHSLIAVYQTRETSWCKKNKKYYKRTKLTAIKENTINGCKAQIYMWKRSRLYTC